MILGWGAMCLVIFLIASLIFIGGDGGDDGDSVPVPVTNSLLIVYESDPGDSSNPITLQQRFIIDSTKIRSWCESKGIEFKAIDKDQIGELQFIDDKWQTLAEAIAGQPLPAWAISYGRTTTAGPLPPTVDDALKKLEGR